MFLIIEELSKRQYVRAILVDLKKAFDTVDHDILLKKLFCLGFRDASFDWFQSYLSNRSQCSVVGEKQSSPLMEGHFGVPQGSVLGPLYFLFTLMIFLVTLIHLPFVTYTIIIQSAKTEKL